MESAMLTEHPYPILYFPRWCATFEHEFGSSHNLFVNVNIVTNDTQGRPKTIYNGYLDLKVVDSNVIPTDPILLQNELVFEGSDSINLDTYDDRTWTNVNLDENHYQEPQFSYLSVDQLQENTYQASKEIVDIVKPPELVFVHKKFRRSTSQEREENQKNNDNPQSSTSSKSENKHTFNNIFQLNQYSSENKQFVGDIYGNSSVSEKGSEYDKVSLKESIAIIENCALKQLMTNFKSPKQKKTILFAGDDIENGQTTYRIENPAMDYKNTEESLSMMSMLNTKELYQCHCNQTFTDIKSYREHATVHKEESVKVSFINPKYCATCNRTFKTVDKFKQHFLGHNNPELECPKCFKILASRYTLRLHMSLHKRKLPCPKCTMTYNSEASLRRHLQNFHEKKSCFECGQSFKTKMLLDSHKSKWHGIIFCKLCNAELCTHNQYLVHLKEHIDQKFSSDDEISVGYKSLDTALKSNLDTLEGVASPSPEPDLSQNKNDNFFAKPKSPLKKGISRVCIVCKKKFDRTSDMKRHLIEHVVKRSLTNNPVNEQGLLSIMCDICGFASFSKIETYKAHLREHANLTTYKCLLCNKSFSDSSNFSKHKKLHGESHFECDMCKRKFNSKKSISLHMELHYKTPPLTCSCCNKKFPFASMLNKHIRNKHCKNDFRVHCRFCLSTFKSLKEKWDHEWSLHKVRNQQLDCLACDTKFRKYSELKRHYYEMHRIALSRAFKNNPKLSRPFKNNPKLSRVSKNNPKQQKVQPFESS